MNTVECLYPPIVQATVTHLKQVSKLLTVDFRDLQRQQKTKKKNRNIN